MWYLIRCCYLIRLYKHQHDKLIKFPAISCTASFKGLQCRLSSCCCLDPAQTLLCMASILSFACVCCCCICWKYNGKYSFYFAIRFFPVWTISSNNRRRRIFYFIGCFLKRSSLLSLLCKQCLKISSLFSFFVLFSLLQYVSLVVYLMRAKYVMWSECTGVAVPAVLPQTRAKASAADWDFLWAETNSLASHWLGSIPPWDPPLPWK